MTLHVALLRGVNVGGRKPVSMSDLRALLGALGFAGARSLLQSGNLVFRCDRLAGAELERLLETEAANRLDLHTDFFVRTGEEWEAVIARNPFSAEAERDPGHLVVMFMKNAPSAKDAAALQSAITGTETTHADGRQLYIVYPNGIGRSRLTGALIEKKLATRGTARNWNTILRLAVSAID
jgi:uncharacterized protein (DUF1697 family)